ncbi:MAG: hypothetical protein GY861_13795 [bacterium]|nr:hypothetical protein [bacterium]
MSDKKLIEALNESNLWLISVCKVFDVEGSMGLRSLIDSNNELIRKTKD